MPYLPTISLPATLWKKGRYHVAQHLQAIYERQLLKLSLLEVATSVENNKRIYGGISIEETNNHFCHRFCASVVRLQNVILDTQTKFGNIPRDILHTFSSHKVTLLDIPCGTGAGGLAIVSIIHELRLARLIPTLPLEIIILAGDFSKTALDIYQSQMENLRPALEATGIIVKLKTMIWNALDLASTDQLYTEWEHMLLPANEGFVLVTNFSGEGAKQFESLKESFRYIAVRISRRNATLLWVEPGDPSGISFLAKVYKSIGAFFFRGSRDQVEVVEPPSSEARWWHELQKKELPIRSAVHQYARPQ